jgi:hypothetical protein
MGFFASFVADIGCLTFLLENENFFVNCWAKHTNENSNCCAISFAIWNGGWFGTLLRVMLVRCQIVSWFKWKDWLIGQATGQQRAVWRASLETGRQYDTLHLALYRVVVRMKRWEWYRLHCYAIDKRNAQCTKSATII